MSSSAQGSTLTDDDDDDGRTRHPVTDFTSFLLTIVCTFVCRRSKHTVVAYRDAIYVFGGDNGYVACNWDCHTWFIVEFELTWVCNKRPSTERICWMTCSALMWRTAHGAGEQCTLRDLFWWCKNIHDLCLVSLTERSPLEPRLPRDITIRLSFMEAACLFLVIFFFFGNHLWLSSCVLFVLASYLYRMFKTFFRWLHGRHLL